ncbi:hypothetical protein D3P09_11880 [Paenibacillus pinisoli]|uniref:Uncharacterized protein n=1 Tax=Paenibacillus pinisoli TaxID=1276110 RepID=A0A3A6PG87_9BACL|nr:hypothetical protein [Paenibacillus pinisoli]RJX40067.1 hypothetical protein D3P09_11880 [Paenibacillus pinisoli]
MQEQLAVLMKWMEEAQEKGDPAVHDHLKMVARILGLQMAQMAKVDEMPQLLMKLIDEIGKGVTAGTLLKHGVSGKLDVRMFNIS